MTPLERQPRHCQWSQKTITTAVPRLSTSKECPKKREKKNEPYTVTKMCHHMLLFISSRRRIIAPKLPIQDGCLAPPPKTYVSTRGCGSVWLAALPTPTSVCVSSLPSDPRKESAHASQSHTRANKGAKEGAKGLSGTGAWCCNMVSWWEH